MAISKVTENSVDQATGTTITLTHGFTIASGDVLVALLNVNAGVGNPTDNNGAYTFTRSDGAASADTSWTSVWYRVAGASEPATYSWTYGTNDRCALIVVQFSGVHADVWDVAPASGNRIVTASGAANMVAPSIDVVTSGAYGLVFASDDYAPTARTFSTVGNSYALVREEAGQQWAAVCGRASLSTGATGTTTVTASGVISSVGWQAALKPAAAATFTGLTVKHYITG